MKWCIAAKFYLDRHRIGLKFRRALITTIKPDDKWPIFSADIEKQKDENLDICRDAITK